MSKTNTLTLKSLKASADYTFRVIVQGKAGKSTPSESIDFQTLIAPPTAPKKVTVRAVDTSSLHITWEASKGAETYLIERYDASTRKWLVLGWAPKTFYDDLSLSANTGYGYRITAFNSTGAGKATSKISGKTL